MNKDAPCKNCEVRNPGCHAACKDYKNWQKERKVMRRSDENERALDGYEYSRAVRCKIWRNGK